MATRRVDSYSLATGIVIIIFTSVTSSLLLVRSSYSQLVNAFFQRPDPVITDKIRYDAGAFASATFLSDVRATVECA
jgi:hypothetical protein